MLNDTKIRNSKPRDRTYKLYDFGGLYLVVATSGAKSWRYDYRIGGHRETLTIGTYPLMGLAAARKKHTAAREQVADGHSPAAAKRTKRLAEKAASITTKAASITFKSVADKWYAEHAATRSRSWKGNTFRWLHTEIYPTIGDKGLTDVKPADVLAIMNVLKDRDATRSAGSIRRLISQIYQHAGNNLLTDYYDPAQSVRKALVMPPSEHHPHLAARDLPAFMAAIDADHATVQTKIAVKLLVHTFVRKTELVQVTWEEIDFGRAEWRISAERMKTRKIHIVPMSVQVSEWFVELRAMSRGSRFVFPHHDTKDKPMSGSALNKMLDRIGYHGKLTPHGLRSTASTALHEMGFKSEVIEMSLAHADRNAVRATYNHAKYLPERHQLMTAWSGFLVAQAGGNVIPLRRAAE